MLDVAFDSVVTMDERGVVLAVNRAAERTFGYSADEMVGRAGRRPDHPAGAARGPPRRAGALPAGRGAGRSSGRRVELTAMRADGTEFPVELVVTRPDVPGERVFYGYLRDLTARYGAEAALHRLADEQAALRRVATAVAAESDPSRLFALVTRGGRPAARCRDRGADPLRRRPRGRGRCVQQAGRAAACPAGTRDAAARRHRRRPRVSHRRAGADGQLRRARRRSSRASCAGTAFRSVGGGAGLPRRPPVGRDGRCSSVEPSSGSRRMPSSGSRTSRSWRRRRWPTRRRARSSARPRARIVQAGDEERRRLERNLHDGAQQRLVSLALMLRLAARRHPEDEDLGRAGEELAHALQELRELARGIHPAVLTERGLEPALRALADRAPVPVELEFAPTSRLPGPVEAAAYYVVSEALTNVAKYAGASHVRVRVDQNGSVRADRGRRRRRGRRRPARRLRPARPRRPRRGARRPPDRREPARRGHHPPRRAPHLKGQSL